MKTKELVKILVEAQNYAEVRNTVDDQTINMIRDHMPSYYDLFREKEETYQSLIQFLNNIDL
jgi:hypothetical protein